MEIRRWPLRADREHVVPTPHRNDLVVAADGGNSATRAKYADVFQPDIETSGRKYIWLGTDRVFDGFELHVVDTPYGPMQIRAYPYGTSGSTFIVDMHERVWRAAGFRSRPDVPAALAAARPRRGTARCHDWPTPR